MDGVGDPHIPLMPPPARVVRHGHHERARTATVVMPAHAGIQRGLGAAPRLRGNSQVMYY